MAGDLNRVVLIGRLVKDPELRHTQNGQSIANFSIANNRSYSVSGERREFTSFFNCIAWGKLGEIIVQFCKKGKQIAVDGRLQQRSWEDQNGNKRSTVEIVVENFQFLSPRQEGEYPDISHSGPADTGGMGPIEDNPFSDEEIPF